MVATSRVNYTVRVFVIVFFFSMLSTLRSTFLPRRLEHLPVNGVALKYCSSKEYSSRFLISFSIQFLLSLNMTIFFLNRLNFLTANAFCVSSASLYFSNFLRLFSALLLLNLGLSANCKGLLCQQLASSLNCLTYNSKCCIIYK